MAKAGDAGCKKCHFGGALKKLCVLAAIVGLVYGALYRVHTRTWPWQDWGNFFRFSKTSTAQAFEKGKEFTRDTVIPSTQRLLARAQNLLERWDTEQPAPESQENGAAPQGEAEQGAFEVAGPTGARDSELITDVASSQSEVPAEKPGREASPPQERDYGEEGREKFREGLKHYQHSSPEMENSQQELLAARGKFQESLELLETAEKQSPDNLQIQEDLQEVQVFLVDCQRRLEVETKSY